MMRSACSPLFLTTVTLIVAAGFLAGASILHPLSHSHDGHDHEGAEELGACAKCVVVDEPTPSLDANVLLDAAPNDECGVFTSQLARDLAATFPLCPRAPPSSS